METTKTKSSKPSTQREEVIAHLKKHGSLTMPDAVRLYNIYRLGAIIHVLRHKDFMNIKTVDMPFISKHGHKGEYAKYVLGKTKK